MENDLFFLDWKHVSTVSVADALFEERQFNKPVLVSTDRPCCR